MSLIKGIQYSDMIGLFFWGATSILMCFMFFLYLKAKEKVYLFYTLFLFFILIYCITHLVIYPGVEIKFLNLIRQNWRFTEPTALISYGFYAFFAQSLLETATQNNKLHTFLNGIGKISLSYAILYLLFFDWILEYERVLFVILRIAIFSVSICGLIWIYRAIESPLKFYFLIGSLAYFSGSLIASLRFLNVSLPYHWMGSLTSTAYFELGILLQALFFAMALGQRIVILHEEKQRTDQALIQQLRKNHEISLENNKTLEKEVNRRVSELIEVKENLQKQEKINLEIEYRNKLIRSEITAKQAQVNPHFIYNSMNALKFMIQKNHNEEAIHYLVKFSRLIRTILEQLEDETIPLDKEIEYIKNYLELEKERFKGLDYSIEIKKETQIHHLPIPPLLLHPLIEIVIWSYLSNNDYNLKKIRILVKEESDQTYLYIYSDTLIETKASKAVNLNGIALAQERIELFNQQNNKYQLQLYLPPNLPNDENITNRSCIILVYKKNEGTL